MNLDAIRAAAVEARHSREFVNVVTPELVTSTDASVAPELCVFAKSAIGDSNRVCRQVVQWLSVLARSLGGEAT